jgi:hypothetical protein
MNRTTTSITIFIAIALSCCACRGQSATVASNQQANSTQTAPAAGELHYRVPDGWVVVQPSSKMRVAQFKLPKADGDSEDAELVVYFFGATQGGTTQANIDRWVSQIQQPDGSSSKDKAKTETTTINGLKVTTVDVAGTYTAEMAPGTGNQRNDASYRLRAAVIETPKGNYFLKLVGPGKTMGHWDQSVTDFVKSIEFK